IVSVVMACNGYRIVDLGVMVPVQNIIKSVQQENANLVGLSGLITPSLEEMAFNLAEFQRAGLTLPVLIGGATTSKVHTAVKLDPHYAGIVAHVNDASLVVEVANKLLSPNSHAQYSAEVKSQNKSVRESYLTGLDHTDRLTVPEARAKKYRSDWKTVDRLKPSRTGVFELPISVEDVRQYIDWSPFFWAWEMKGTYPNILKSEKYGEEARKLLIDAQAILDQLMEDPRVQPRIVMGIFRAEAQDESVITYDQNNERLETLHFDRQTKKKFANNDVFYSLADFIAPKDSGIPDYWGGFAVTTGIGCDELVAEFEADHDDYNSIMAKAIADRLAEAFAEKMHELVRKEYWGYSKGEQLATDELIKEEYQGIRPAPGYPACPDHT
ncbi:MAG: methionine synthase, partial [Proteobacteria bacterium]